MSERSFQILLAVLIIISAIGVVEVHNQMKEFEERVNSRPAPMEVQVPEQLVAADIVKEPVEEVIVAVKDTVEDVNVEVAPPDVEEPPYTEWEHEILSIIIYQEAGGDKCSDDTRRKVGSVFLNRVASPLFPDTFEEVATGHRQYGTLYLTGIKWPERASLKEEERAVQRAKDIAEEILISGSILPSNVIWQAEFRQGDGIYCHQDSIYFCYSEVSE